MPEVRQADHHRVHVLARADLLVVVVGIDGVAGETSRAVRLLEFRFREVAAARIEVAHRDNARTVAALQHARHLKLRRDAAETDHGYADHLVGRKRKRGATRQHERCSGE